MKPLWYRWQGHSQHDPLDLHQGVIKVHHHTGVAIQLARQNITVTNRALLPALKQHRLTLQRFWASWFTRWHSLISNGFDMAQSLKQLHLQSASQQEAELSEAALLVLNKGVPISQAFKQTPLAMNKRHIQLMEFAEQAGQFEHVLAQLSTSTTNERDRTQQLRQALRYPAAVLSMVALLGGGLKLFILPKFAALYAETNAQLPPFTQFLLEPSRSFQLPVFTAVVFLVIGLISLTQLWFPLLLKQPKVRQLLSRNAVWHSYMELSSIQQDMNALALGLQHGMTLQQSILSVALTHSSSWRQKQWFNSLQELKAGHNSVAIFKHHKMTVSDYALIELGEQTGTLDEKVLQVANAQQQAIAQRLQNSLQLLPNLVLIVVSILTGAVMIALYLPLFQLGLAVG